jgi:signal transduction histidine kinase
VPVIPEEDQEWVTQNISSISAAQPIITHEHRVILPSGEIRWQQWTNGGVMFDDPGTVIEFQAVGRDITELKQVEAEMSKALEKEREVSELRSSIVQLVSHQFRNPLTVIQFSADLLQNYNDKLSDESQFDLNCTSNEAIFRIQDSGIGISPEDLQQLFEGFVRGKHVGDIPGTGLGLAIVKQCVDVHGGKITVESEVGVGTTFTVTLPLH